MKNISRKEYPNHARKALVIAMTLAFAGTALAETDDVVTRLIKPESSLSLGIGQLSGDSHQRFGMYNGMSKTGSLGLVDFSIVRRDDESGTWFRALGTNLGLDNGELRIEQERQGHWGYFLDYDQITRNSPYTVLTKNTGIGTPVQTVPVSSGPGPLTAYNLKTERQKTSFGANGSLSTLIPNLEFHLLYQNETKEGQRLFGRGTIGAQEFLAEPINSTTDQLDFVIDYTGESLQLSGGYYGSFFRNSNSALKIVGGNPALSSVVIAASPTPTAIGVAQDNIGLPPDNQAHQFHLTGGYQFNKTTRMTFKVAKTFATQNDDFMATQFSRGPAIGVSANTSGRTDLGGRLDTTLVNLGITSRPIQELSLLGKLRYEERDDKTAVAQYITGFNTTNTNVNNPSASITNLSATGSTNGYNEPRSLTNKSGKFEASYLLPEGFRVTGGFDIDRKERTMSGVRVVGYRENTDESTYRLEVNRSMAESLTGSLTYLHSDRTGSGYQNLVTLNGTNNYPSYTSLSCGDKVISGLAVTRCGLIQPIYMADRVRDKIRLMTDWSPTEQLSTQFTVEASSDNYGAGRGSPDIGVRQGDAWLFSADLAYTLSERWKLTGWYSRTGTRIDQASIANPAAGNAGAALWSASQRNYVDTFGIGLRAKLPFNIDGGADYLYSNDRSSYGMAHEAFAAFSPSAPGPGVLPDIKYRQNTLRFFGAYNIDKDTKLRLDYVFDQRLISDWTWDGFKYSDGTQVSGNAKQIVRFLGISMVYAFR